MARPLRIKYEGALYHVTARGNERKKIYFSETDYNKFLEYTAEAEKKYGILLHCYALMPNHYHLLIETPGTNISQAMHYINGSYTTYINIKNKRSGHLFQGRYKAIVVDKDSYLLELSRYIHLNPVRAGMVKMPQDYPYSSYRAYTLGREDKIITKDFILSMLAKGKREAADRYRVFVENGIGEELKNPLDDVYGGIILGRERFIKDTLSRISEAFNNREEISYSRRLKAEYESEEIFEIIEKHFKLTRDAITERRLRDSGKTAIYLMKKYTCMTNREIGQLFRGHSYSAIAKINKRFEERLSSDKKLKRMIANIEKEMSNVKG